MPEILIESVDDPRLSPYRDLKCQSTDAADVFIAEGEKLVVRLLRSRCRVDSILCTPDWRVQLPPGLDPAIPVYVAATPTIAGLIGFKFHRGVLAAGRPPNKIPLEEILTKAADRPRSLIVVCPEIRDPENLGSIMRTAKALGAAGLIVGAAGTAPYSRRVLRTSMGAVFELPVFPTTQWNEVADLLHRFGYESVAAVLDTDAVNIDGLTTPQRSAVYLGNEGSGLAPEIGAMCRRRVRIPMADGEVSLNVAVAAGILLHHFSPIRG